MLKRISKLLALLLITITLVFVTCIFLEKHKLNETTIIVNTEERVFNYYVPDNLPNEGVSLLFRFHGSLDIYLDSIKNPILFENMVTDTDILNDIADKENIIIVYPVGMNNGKYFNWTDTEKNLDFFDEMLNYFDENFNNIDTNRIYVCGHSSGAIFSYGLAGYREDVIAAAVPVAGQYSISKRLDKLDYLGNEISVPIRAYNATEDERVQYKASFNNFSDWVDEENLGNSLDYIESSIKIDDYDINVFKWIGGISDYEMYAIKDEKHSISWTKIAPSMWEFMNAHPKN